MAVNSSRNSDAMALVVCLFHPLARRRVFGHRLATEDRSFSRERIICVRFVGVLSIDRIMEIGTARSDLGRGKASSSDLARGRTHHCTCLAMS